MNDWDCFPISITTLNSQVMVLHVGGFLKKFPSWSSCKFGCRIYTMFTSISYGHNTISSSSVAFHKFFFSVVMKLLLSFLIIYYVFSSLIKERKKEKKKIRREKKKNRLLFSCSQVWKKGRWMKLFDDGEHKLSTWGVEDNRY